jgi:DJ-1 family protein
MKRLALLLAEGGEEMETVIIADVIRRSGVKVELVGLRPGPVLCSRGIVITPDTDLSEVEIGGYDGLLLPGGMGGMKNLSADERVLDAVRSFDREGKLIGAICAAPLVLQEAGLLAERRVTCHPGVADMLTETARSEERVVVDANIVSSQGPGTATEFALRIVEILAGKDVADQVAVGLVI